MIPREKLLFDYATQYYVAGRMAARARLVPVYGNLLHHAVEMFLKTALRGTVQPHEMKQKYRHDLEKLWARFKTNEADRALDRFDVTVRALHKFEELRYPDEIPHPRLAMSMSWKSSGNLKSFLGRRRPLPEYEVPIRDVDRLVIEILDHTRLNPKAFVGVLDRSGRGALLYQNPHAERWRHVGTWTLIGRVRQ
jgi:hypothetical protein